MVYLIAGLMLIILPLTTIVFFSLRKEKPQPPYDWKRDRWLVSRRLYREEWGKVMRDDPCEISPFSSRMCELRTKGCDVRHQEGELDDLPHLRRKYGR